MLHISSLINFLVEKLFQRLLGVRLIILELKVAPSYSPFSHLTPCLSLITEIHSFLLCKHTRIISSWNRSVRCVSYPSLRSEEFIHEVLPTLLIKSFLKMQVWTCHGAYMEVRGQPSVSTCFPLCLRQGLLLILYYIQQVTHPTSFW